MRIRTIYLLFSILLTGAGTGRLWAQTPKAPPDLMDTSLEDLMKVEIDSVHGASKYRRKVAAAPLTNSPQVLGQANLSVLLLHKKLFASMDLQYVSRRRTLAGDFAGAHAVPNFTPHSPNALRRWEFSASIYNAFDKLYGDPASVAHLQDIIYQDGRNYRLKFTYHF